MVVDWSLLNEKYTVHQVPVIHLFLCSSKEKKKHSCPHCPRTSSSKISSFRYAFPFHHRVPQTRTCSGAQEKNSKCVITSGMVATNVNFLWPGFSESQIQAEANKLNHCWEETFS